MGGLGGARRGLGLGRPRGQRALGGLGGSRGGPGLPGLPGSLSSLSNDQRHALLPIASPFTSILFALLLLSLLLRSTFRQPTVHPFPFPLVLLPHLRFHASGLRSRYRSCNSLPSPSPSPSPPPWSWSLPSALLLPLGLALLRSPVTGRDKSSLLPGLAHPPQYYPLCTHRSRPSRPPRPIVSFNPSPTSHLSTVTGTDCDDFANPTAALD